MTLTVLTGGFKACIAYFQPLKLARDAIVLLLELTPTARDATGLLVLRCHAAEPRAVPFKISRVLAASRRDSVKAVFLVTDGYSNGGDPRPAAEALKRHGVTIFTFGIRNGNVEELYDMASHPREEHSYILESFEEFEALARRALHEDLQTGSLVDQNPQACSSLCPAEDGGSCCDVHATCTCGTHTGHYLCTCQPGYYGTGLRGNCK
ncbi:sushi, von Willebrand factor type A, EGF and pentraxin domain-containing protein 1-like, partial [Hyalella azteca]|uniref:Sushi, von Willebrand factor type A, EGF and pentraxin domain-containing protein 1-like n=1 Tax=Hyalella azteca TaxID=294128 RepID=A0A8B7PBG2_HYAAZ